MSEAIVTNVHNEANNRTQDEIVGASHNKSQTQVHTTPHTTTRETMQHNTQNSTFHVVHNNTQNTAINNVIHDAQSNASHAIQSASHAAQNAMQNNVTNDTRNSTQRTCLREPQKEARNNTQHNTVQCDTQTDKSSSVNSITMVFMNTPGKKATIRDVARLAGVSYGTVSRYLNGNAHVSEDAAQRIAQAIEDAQYTPNNAARSLAQRRTLTVALIIQIESRETIVQDSTSRAMAGANQVLGEAGYQMVTVIANTEESTQRIAQLVQSDFADGYLLFALSNDHSLERTFLATQRPVVGSEVDDSENVVFPTVDFANEEGQRNITQYLLDREHTHLLYVCGPSYASASLNRLRGFKSAIGSNFREDNVYYADDWEITSGEMAVITFQDKLADTDGIVCANDNIAVGVINQLNRLGYRVPEDIAVTGFDDSPMAMLANPKLTTVRQDSLIHGETMAKLLLDMIGGKDVAQNHVILLPTSIMKRQSA